MENVNVKINGLPVSVPAGTTILEAAKAADIEIPTLCWLKGVNCLGDCRVCVVEVKNRRGLVASCVQPAEEGMEISTNTQTVRSSRKTTLELILSSHHKKCLSCVRSSKCELQRLATDYSVNEDRFASEEPRYEIDDKSAYVVRDNNKCILCRRCVSACEKIQGIGAIGLIARGYNSHIGSAFERTLDNSPCVGCGQCIVACPVGALYEKNDTDKAWDAINDPSKKVVVFTAPSVRATLGEAFDMPVGTNVEGKMVAAIRRLGVEKVFNMDLTADVTIIEEANEFLGRVQNGGVLPMITSCSPGWVKFCEHFYPEFIPNLSSCKSPQQMFGAILKNYYCQKTGIDPKDLYVISVIPCTAKKFEVGREEQKEAGLQYVDIALTTRELGRMIKSAGIKFTELKDEEFDSPMGTGSGAGNIFGATGGVMEAALRTAARTLDGDFSKLDFKEVRGTKGIKEAAYNVAGIEVKVAAVSGLANARKLLDDIKAGKKEYHFIEIMACPGGCVNGGGQPILNDSVRNYTDLKTLRAKALYDADKKNPLRLSHENPDVKVIYDEFFGTPGSSRAHHILHTHYVERYKF